MLSPFVFTSWPSRVVFGSGTISQLGVEVDRLGLSRLLVVSTSQQRDQAESVMQMLPDRTVASFFGARMHTPVSVTEDAMRLVTGNAIDGIVAIGGGSTTGLAKAIAYRTDLPQIVIPTTYAGSEMTPILGETENGAKITRSDPRILPEVVIYDVDKTLALPVSVSVTSGLNAIAHSVEALYAVDRNPIITMYAEAAISSLCSALKAIAKNPRDQLARSKALYGAWLSGICLGSVGMALHHKLCHVLGGTFDLPHAETHAAVLPHAVSYNSGFAKDAMYRIARALGAEDAATGLYDLAHDLGCTMALRDLGMPESGVNTASEAALKNQYPNPRPLEESGIKNLLTRAWSGIRP
ncbi:maleylacetate reductase [Burkholderia sp. Ac-20353]|nr:maleylacetate reductase [Burkholderia sp. Ac-20353]